MKKIVLSIIFFNIFLCYSQQDYTGRLTHSQGYFSIKPYNSSYDDGSYAKLFYDGNNKRIGIYNSATSTPFTDLDIGNLYVRNQVYSYGKGRFGTGINNSVGLTVVDWTHDKNWNNHANSWSGYIGFNAFRDNGDDKDVFKGINPYTSKGVIEGSNFGFRFLYRNRVYNESQSPHQLEEVFKINNSGVVFAKSHNALSITGSNPKTSVYGFNNKIEFLNGGHGAIVFHPDQEDELMFGMHQNGNFYWGHRNKNSSDPSLSAGKYSMFLDADTSNLGIRGKLTASEVKVKIDGWADFVFKDTYKLPNLTEVEQHIEEKGHLKDIPSAKEVEENGIHLGEMNSKLLQKIEELTLYAIQQQKEIEKLKRENMGFKNLSERLNKLENKNNRK